MTNPKHTPGPWIAAIDPGITTVDGNKCKVFGAKSSFFAVIDGCEYSEGLANARLIAAAPEMLEALEIIAQEWVPIQTPGITDKMWSGKIDQVRNLIKKAKGES